jgi:ribosomal subunit interface protein
MPTNHNRDREILIEVTSRHQNVSERTRSYVTEKAGKLTRFHNRLSRIQVVLDEAHDDFLVEMIAHVDRGATLVAKESAKGYRAAMDAILAKMERQLKKDSEKRKDHKIEGAKGFQEPASPDQGPSQGGKPESGGDGDGEETYEDVVRKDLET